MSGVRGSAEGMHSLGEVEQQSDCLRTKASVKSGMHAEARGELAHLGIELQVQPCRLVRQRLQLSLPPGMLDVSGPAELLGGSRRVKNFFSARLGSLERRELLQFHRIRPEEAHDLFRRQDTPVVGLRVVSEPGQPPPPN